MSTDADPRFGVIVPVKPPVRAKSRLLGLGDAARQDLVAAFAADTITAALECPLVEMVLAVTDDHLLAAGLADLGARVLPDGTTDDLNGSLVQAAAELGRRRPRLRPVALCADLPALRPAELTRVLAEAARHLTAFVPDADEVGTTAFASSGLDTFHPLFGAGSRKAHLGSGAEELVLDDIATVRRDVDTPADLAAALDLGVGVRTSLVVTGRRL